MRRGSEIVGLPVVSVTEGNRIGAVKDLVVDLSRRRVAALSLGEDLPSGQIRILPFDSIRRIGRDAVMVEDESVVVPLSERPDLLSLYESPVKLVGLDVLTEEGTRLGRVSDILIDEDSGEMVDFEISAGPLRDVVRGRGYVPADSPIALGQQMMVVPLAVASESNLRGKAQPLVMESPPWGEEETTPAQMELLAAEVLSRQEELVLGRRLQKAIADEDAGGVIAYEGETITQEIVDRAKAAGKLNLLIQSAGEAAREALAAGVTARSGTGYAGRMASRTVHMPDGGVLVSQGDAVTLEVVDRAREVGVMDQLAAAVRPSAGRRREARALWEEVGDRLGFLTGRR